jgi:hypothetical protein
MADEPNQGAAAEAPDVAGAKPSGDAGPAGAGAPASGELPLGVAAASDLYEDHPELFVGAAFVGGFAIAQILKRLGE